MFKEISPVWDKEEAFDKSLIFLYYFGKFIRVFISEWENDNSGNFRTKHKNIISILKNKEEDVYNKIMNVLFD